MKVPYTLAWTNFSKIQFYPYCMSFSSFFRCFHRMWVALREQMCLWRSWNGEREWLHLQVGTWGRRLARDHRTAPKKQFQINQGFLSVRVSGGQVLLAVAKSGFRGVFPQPPM